MSEKKIKNINEEVSFASGRVAELLKQLESFLGVALSLRSSTGEVVCKTDYFYGPCSVIRGTERGRIRCRKTYKQIENRLFRRKMPFVSICYAGFLIFSVPLEFRGEMVGTLLGSQVLPFEKIEHRDLESFFDHTILALGMTEKDEFYKTFSHVASLRPDFQRASFLNYLSAIGKHFISMVSADKTWDDFLKEMRAENPFFGNY